MKVSPKRLKNHLTRWQVPTVYVPGWDSAKIDPYNGQSDFQGVLLHHTAGVDSLAYCTKGTYPPVRNCHFLVGRDGTVYVLSGSGAYHAGQGGPLRITATTTIPKDKGNQHLYGIEIESLGTSSKIDGSKGGMTVDQVTSTALLTSALLDAMRLGPLFYRVGRVFRHRDWAPARKIDTKQDLAWWRRAVWHAKRNRADKRKAVADVRDFVAQYPNGRYPT